MPTYEETYQSSLEYFQGTEIAAKVFADKYALRDSNDEMVELNPDDMHHRIAKNLARVEKKKFKTPLTEQEIYSYLKDFRQIIPQGSCMYGIGNQKYVSYSNCFVVGAPFDSYAGIMTTDQHIAQISKRRGGIGYDISTLRPAGQVVQNSARTTTGAVSFMHRFSSTGREVGQFGRRGAQMISISIHHPDVEEFINVKNDEKSVTGANISVRLSNEFLEAVLKDEEYEQRWPVDANIPEIVRNVSAKDIWKKIIHSAWNRGEPGLMFWDNIIDASVPDCYAGLGFKSESTNPCQPAWAKILTPEGIREFRDLSIGDTIWSKDGWTIVINKVSNDIKKVYKYTTTAGVFYGTKNHKLVTDDKKNTQTCAEKAESISIITGPLDIDSEPNIEDVMDGLVIGDGTVHKASGNLVGLIIGDDDQDYFNSEVKGLIIKYRPGVHDKFYEIKTSVTNKELPYTYERSVPTRFLYGNNNKVSSFLRGIYSANGSVCGNRITLKSSSLKIIEDIQMMLSSIGIRSYYTTNKSKTVKFDNGDYECKQSYDLNITTDRNLFVKYIGFIQKYKNDKIKLTQSNRVKTVYDIISVEEISEEEVFDITVDNITHTYWTQGCNVANCGELVLPAYDSCRLLAINIFDFVNNPYTKDANFDFDRFYEVAQTAQRLMDDIVTLEEEALDRILKKIKSDPEPDSIKAVELDLWKAIREKCIQGRRTGLGLTALGDTIAALGIKYGAKKSIEITEEIYKTLKLGSYRSSVDMAKELGPFPIWDWNLEKNCPFLMQIKDEDPKLYKDMAKHGRRNIANLTNAPTGSLSMLASLFVDGKKYVGTSSGIEPVYALSFYRRKKINHDDVDTKVDFVDSLGDKWMEFEILHPGLEVWKSVNPKKNVENSPYHGACATDINWTSRVKLQAAAQRHIDHSISSTINLPNDVKEEEVAKIYEAAWKNNLKGITVYRDGCRSGVLITKTEDEKRPRELDCDVHHISVRGIQYFVLVGMKEGKPYEVFAGKNGFLPKKISTGTIIRKNKKFYKAVFEGFEEELSPITASTNEMEECVTRLTSGLLRSGADMNLVVKQLEKVGERQELNSFARSVARALKKYIPDGTEISDKCPECEGKLVRKDGCPLCQNCAWSSCL